ncbi:hypothetical protein, partial [uncultured Clostridium sp.]|uniref:hypothetical protein n=1 Tax=uncultured Clostridium sp. TaxID=59620 RepID=UPI0025FA5C70
NGSEPFFMKKFYAFFQIRSSKINNKKADKFCIVINAEVISISNTLNHHQGRLNSHIKAYLIFNFMSTCFLIYYHLLSLSWKLPEYS